MDKIIELHANGALLRLEMINEFGWCQVYLINDKVTSLGADTFAVIKDRLTNYLRSNDSDMKQIITHNDYKLQWILSLSEKHAAIYGTLASDNGDLRIFCVEDGGYYLPEVYLQKPDVERWIFELESGLQIK